MVRRLRQVFFQPELYTPEFTTPLPEVVDKVIQTSPIDTRRALYKVIRVCKHLDKLAPQFGRSVPWIRFLVVLFRAFRQNYGMSSVVQPVLHVNGSEHSSFWRINNVQRFPEETTKRY